MYLFTSFPCAVYKTRFSRDYMLLPGAYSRETTVGVVFLCQGTKDKSTEKNSIMYKQVTFPAKQF